MPTKKPPAPEPKELATVPVKLNYTPSEIAIIEKARAIQHARKNGPWIRDVSLEVARQVIAAAEWPGKKGSR